MQKLRSWMGITLAVVISISVFIALTASTTATTAEISGEPSEEVLPVYMTTHHDLQNRSVEYASTFEALNNQQGERLITGSRRAFPDAHYYPQVRKRLFERFNSVTEGEEQPEENRFGGLPTIPSLGEPRLTQGSSHLNLSGNYSTLWNESHEVNGTDAAVIPDIDGDGNLDVLVLTWKYNLTSDTWTYRLIAKNGANGTHLWEQSINDTSCGIWVDYWFGDFNGDGFNDVIVYEWTYNLSLDIETVRVIVKNGANGTHLWEQSINGTYCDIWIDWIVDLDGDGFDDVIVYEWTYNTSTDIDTDKLIAKKGTNGAHFWEQTVSAKGYWNSDIWPTWIVDLDGDEKVEVIVREYEDDDTADTETDTLVAKNGTTGEHLWEQTVSGNDSSIWLEFSNDLDNDGLPDFIVREYAYNATAAINTAKLIAKKGTNGTHLWEQYVNETTSEIGIWYVGDLDNDNLDDLIVREYKYNGTTTIETVTVLAKKGINGTHLWAQSVNGTDCGIEIWLADDLNGDGLLDTILAERTYNETADVETVIVMAKTGSTGSTLWEQTVSGNESGVGVWLPGDLDGDGIEDAIVREWYRNESTGRETAQIIAKTGKNGTHLWEQTVSGNESGVSVTRTGKLDDDDLNDVIVYEWDYDESADIETRKLIAKTGKNGTHLWEQSVNARGRYNCSISVERLLDLDGNSLDDVIVYEREYNESADSETRKLIAKTGKNGTHLWEQSINASGQETCYIWIERNVNLDEDELPDFIVVTEQYNETTGTATAGVIAIKGTNGTLWEQTVSGADAEIWIEWDWITDLNGDNLDDVIVYEWEFNETTNTSSAAVIAKRGYDGTHLWEENVSGNISWIHDVWADWLVDLDDDGLDDVIVYEVEVNATTFTLTESKIIAKRGYDGMHLFEAQSDEEIWFAFQWLWWDAYDLDGDGQNDLLLLVPTEVHAVTYSVSYPNLFDTGESSNPYPSIGGTFNGTITPQDDTVVHTMYTYPCAGTGGHSEYVRIWGNGIDVNATWNGYAGDWQTITFDEVTLEAGRTYNITIELGSYPQILHETPVNATGGTITCATFEDANGKIYYNWIPAIRIE